MENTKLNQNEKRVLTGLGLATMAGLASAGPVSSAAAAIDFSDVLTGVGLAGVAIIGVVLAIKGIKYLKSAL
ncbi:hypothetical protein [Comamonas testosteroni]|uniref:hypothetical protein n=1 Tax=Comamonas testosteroni TaxID=285 RepID=UPI0026ED9725|nr:hypothetical protein [Comamonas testosteroni]